jgi:hypothetical protein
MPGERPILLIRQVLPVAERHTDLNGTQPHTLRYHREVIEVGQPADDAGCR